MSTFSPLFDPPTMRTASEQSTPLHERATIIEALLDPRLFDIDGVSALDDPPGLFEGLALRCFRLISHHDATFRLPPVLEIHCLNPEAYDVVMASMEVLGGQDRLCQAMAYHGYRALRLVDGGRFHLQLLRDSTRDAGTGRVRLSSLRSILEPLFQGRAAVVPRARVAELLWTMRRSQRLEKQLHQALWKEDQGNGNLHLTPLPAGETELGLVSAQIFENLFEVTGDPRKTLLREVALSAAWLQETVIPDMVRDDFLRLLDNAPALRQRLSGLRWQRHGRHGSLRLEPVGDGKADAVSPRGLQASEPRLDALIQQLLRRESLVVPADLRSTFLNLLETTTALRAVAARAHWRVHQRSGLMMLEFAG